ncbi:unnamed protein product [Durusdinium trenchii]|uniref:Uncharacterized protein n=2 Tax=Durusdinium trenchii TaxID=1381693 RepID=A0ABP0M2L6_9DINO
MADSSAVQHLARAHQTHGATVALLPAMRRAAAALAVPMADREYRRGFSENYIMLLSDEYYRPEILSAALVQEHDLWVNGHLHQLAEATLGKGRVLKNCFLDICSLLTDCGRVSTVTGRYPLSRLRNSLSAFEAMWVQFEEAYIKELIYIEELSKKPLKEAIFLEFDLLAVEFPASKTQSEPPSAEIANDDSHSDNVETASQLSLPKSRRSSSSSEFQRSRHHTLSDELPPTRWRALGRKVPLSDLQHLALSACSWSQNTTQRECLERLVRQVAILNSCANMRGKGRGDLSIEVLEVAADVYLSKETSQSQKVHKTLAEMVLSGFLELRHYLHKASQRMLWIDPQLSNNSELERCLVAWEEAWELGQIFLLHLDTRNAFCAVAAAVAQIQETHAGFLKLVEDQDAELFLILPRLVILSGLWEPSYGALLHSFLPEEHSTWPQLQQQFQDLCSSSLARTGCERSWGSWVSHMLHGPGIKSAEDGEGWNDALDASREEAFLRDVEGVSMHLQRHQPERWNRCCHLLLRCSARAFDSWVPPQPGMLSI